VVGYAALLPMIVLTIGVHLLAARSIKARATTAVA